jgi:hypothetical protein
MFPPEGDQVILRQTTHYVCVQCGKPGVVDTGYTLIDPRYALGRCTGDHVGKQQLIREDVNATPKRKRKRRKHAPD